MTHLLADMAVDACLSFLQSNANKLVICEGAPSSFANANTNNGSGSGQKIAEVALASGDFTIGDDPVDGRRITCAAKSSLPVLADGDADHVAWLDTTNSRILKIAPLTTMLPLTTAATVNVPVHYHVILDAIDIGDL